MAVHINLRLPTSYNRCSLPELRAIAAVMSDCALRASRFHPFDMMEVKVAVFLRLTNLEIVEPLNPRVPVEEQYYVVRTLPYTVNDEERRWFRLFRWHRNLKAWFRHHILGHDDSFSLYLWQIHSWLSSSKSRVTGKVTPGLLDWLDADNPDSLLIFPLSSIRRSFRARWFSIGSKVTFAGPAPLMDGFSWQRYRFAQDYMQNYINASNRLLQLQKMGNRVSAADILRASKNLDLAKALFLATIFCRRITYVDEETGRTKTDYRYQSNQHSDNAPYFRNFPDTDWQLVLLWWQGMMHYLQKTYPKVFKKQKVSKDQKAANPLELYTRTTATMEKYISATASEVDHEPYTTILQHIEDIIKNNEEMERINASMKRKS